MNTPILVVPDFSMPLELHTPEYEEVVEKDGITKYVLICDESSSAMWRKNNRKERRLDEAAKVAADTASLLLQLGMNVQEDEIEQEEYFTKFPTKIHKSEKNRIPNNTDALDIFKSIHSHIRDNALFNTPAKYNLKKVCYKEVIDELGIPISTPFMDVEIDFGGKKLQSKQFNRYGLGAFGGLDSDAEAGANANAPLPPHDIYTSKVALKLAGLLNEYDRNIVKDAAQLRTYITNKLIEISDCGNAKDELRALELLGKISDVGLFIEKSEINIVNTTPAALEHAIKDKINRLLGQRNIEIEDAVFTTPQLIENEYGNDSIED
jgi:hypothetical protein